MISVKTALETVLSKANHQSEILKVAIDNCENHYLAENIFASIDQPPFDRVAMDGIAINFHNFSINQATNEGIQAAGVSQLSLKNQQNYFEVMTGAILPSGTDCVIPYEHVEWSGDQIKNIKQEYLQYQNIHKKGMDYKQGDHLIDRSTFINSPIKAILASQGSEKISIISPPKIAILSTGSELQTQGKTRENYQIYSSNIFAIEHELKQHGFFHTSTKHLNDSYDLIKKEVEHQLQNNDIIIISGGISKGKFDFVPDVLKELGVNILFHGVLQKPGKPILFGTFKDKKIFALPGNPVSSLVCLRYYVIQSLYNSYGKSFKQILISTGMEIKGKPKLTLFIPIKIELSNAVLTANPIKTNGSGDFYSLKESDGFIEIPPTEDMIPQGYLANFYPWGRCQI